ncbi:MULTISPECIES: DUF6879 family protein [unclassified Streptomyces]|uniref:DUF6879 family protein n=1 Tax=unclassified Streptomyces TaxID=2593676 RepID=UPI000DC77E25|nr:MULTISPECIES: DUF6879 family protein [unclassified Streptomyces]AWZ08466.1 hypothetical protein DRB89_32135 [Streptomyces sp. ICC4]AWZ16242.1 hypothetical protein DRB96_32905 [Streptomyces sp. ICC1]
MPQKPLAPSFEDLLDSAQQRALHLELRDVYAVGEEREVFEAFGRDGSVPADDSEYWGGWLPLVERTVARGVKVQRARIVSEPVTEYIRFEHAITDANLRAGEEVRWLPRRRAPTLALPGNDFWLIDDRIVRFNFSGDGQALEPDHTEDPQAVKLCAEAFRSVWDLATPHADYRI